LGRRMGGIGEVAGELVGVCVEHDAEDAREVERGFVAHGKRRILEMMSELEIVNYMRCEWDGVDVLGIEGPQWEGFKCSAKHRAL
jgi:hypothetical protein